MKNFFLHTIIGNILLFIILILSVLGIIFINDSYKEQFAYTSYFYACPDNGTSKCYKIEVGFGEPSCDEVHCVDSVPNKLFFENGGYVDVSCISTEKEKWFCSEVKTRKHWDIQFAEKIRFKK